MEKTEITNTLGEISTYLGTCISNAPKGGQSLVKFLGWVHALDAAQLELKPEPAAVPSWRNGKPFCGSCALQIDTRIKFCPTCGTGVRWNGTRDPKRREPHLMTADEFHQLVTGTGWIEWYPDDEIPADDNVMRAAWVDGHAIMLDRYDGESTGPLPLLRYNRPGGFRIWTAQPTVEQQKEAEWDG